MRISRALILVLFCLCLSFALECYGQKVGDILTDPFKNAGLSPGTSRDRVVDRYGEPDSKSLVSSDEWNEPREEWFYSARYSAIPMPVNVGYFSEDMYLYFDGDNLTNISKEALGKSVQDDLKSGVIR